MPFFKFSNEGMQGAATPCPSLCQLFFEIFCWFFSSETLNSSYFMYTQNLLAMLTISSLLVGCVTEGDILREKGYPRAYTEGYDDGCSSGKRAAGSMFDEFKKNVHRFQDDPDYHDGWKDGHDECKSQWLETRHEIERNQDRYEREKTKKDYYRW